MEPISADRFRQGFRYRSATLQPLLSLKHWRTASRGYVAGPHHRGCLTAGDAPSHCFVCSLINGVRSLNSTGWQVAAGGRESEPLIPDGFCRAGVAGRCDAALKVMTVEPCGASSGRTCCPERPDRRCSARTVIGGHVGETTAASGIKPVAFGFGDGCNGLP